VHLVSESMSKATEGEGPEAQAALPLQRLLAGAAGPCMQRTLYSHQSTHRVTGALTHFVHVRVTSHSVVCMGSRIVSYTRALYRSSHTHVGKA
jgi:hypothetical protein